jgi:hypothetical protein
LDSDREVQQARKMMMKRTQFLRLLDHRLKPERPKATTVHGGKI